MFDIGGVDRGADNGIRVGQPVGTVTAFDPAGHKKVPVASGVKLRRAAGTGRRDLNRRLALLPGNRKARQVCPGKPFRIPDDKCHSLAAEARCSLGQRWLVGEGRNHPEPIDAGNIGGADDRLDLRMASHPSVQIAEGEIGKVMRVADGAHKKRALGPAVGPETFADIDLGASVQTLHRGADRFAGGRHHTVDDGAAGIHHRLNDLGIAGTAAQHAAKRVLDALPVRRAVLAKKRSGGHHHAGCADAALRRAMPQEGCLQGRQGVIRTSK